MNAALAGIRRGHTPKMHSKVQEAHGSARKERGRGARQLLILTTKLLSQGACKKALKLLSAAAVRHERDAAILTRYADALYLNARIAEARDTYQKALALDETIFQAWYGLGCAELSREAFAAASMCFRRAIAIRPEDTESHLYLGKSLYYMGEVDGAIDELRVAAKSHDSELRWEAMRNIATIIPGSASRGNSTILRARREWARLAGKMELAQGGRCAIRSKPNSKVRVGYLSAFFAARNWMKPVWGTLQAHDRSAFEIHLFLDGERPGAGSGYRRCRSDRIHDITGLSNEAAAKKVSAAGIDILVDLNGYSFPSRLGLFLRRPARTIVGWFNLYATSGISAFDYIIGDAQVIPAAEERFYTERVLRVAGCYLAFSVLYPVPPVSPPPCSRTGQITFGCLAPQYKINEQVIRTWARILRAAPHSRLLLKNTCLGDASNRVAVLARFARHGIAEERLILEGPAEHYEFLKAYARMDIALDTFPYNGGTTTAEALWQGVPVLTFNGDRWASRTSRSILVAAGLEDWAAPSRKAFVERAVELALSHTTPGRLAALRQGMRGRIIKSQACDTVALCKELERHYREMANEAGKRVFAR